MEPIQPEIYIQPGDPSVTATRWVIIAASVQGTSHIRLLLPCQDTHTYRIINDGILVAAVADGLGSATCSQAGAQLAATEVSACLEQALYQTVPDDEKSWIELVKESFHAARARLEQEARQNQAALQEYGTTLIAAILTSEWLVTGQIGDGAVVAALEDGQLILATLPQNGEYINTTFPLTLPDMESKAEFKAQAIKVKALALMTDGIQYVSIRSADQTPHQPFFEPLFRQLPGVRDVQKASQNLAEFMISPQISSRSDDDKTLVLIGRRSG
jgi:hypothetical protein